MIANIGELSFNTKQQAIKFTRDLIIVLENDIVDCDNNYYTFFENLISNHPEAEEKIGCGIKYFFFNRNILNNALQTNIRRVDNSTVNFSWISCCNSKGKTINQSLISAMRNSIAYQSIEFRDLAIMKCRYCGDEGCDMHIDHETIPFKTISKNFLELHSDGVPSSFDKCEKTNLTMFKKTDIDFANDWNAYHKKLANLQVLCKTCNLKKPK